MISYFKTVDEDGFLTISTLDIGGQGNINQTEHERLSAFFRNAPDGYGVKEIDDTLEYVKQPNPDYMEE